MISKPIQNLTQAKQWLFRDLPVSPRQTFKGEVGLARGRYLMSQLGNPQDSYPAVHIAGTSGKGSTAYMISGLLRASGKTVGLHVSPHVYDFRERMQVNGELVSEVELCRHINDILPVVEAMSLTEFGSPTYFEVALALAHLVFREHEVDYGVIETGLGGLYDVTNLVTRPDKLAVLAQIGLDHTAILGDTIREIAAQKAGIIQADNHVIALWQNQQARVSFDKRAKQMQANLEYVKPSEVIRVNQSGRAGTNFDLKMGEWNWAGLTLAPVGQHQVSNAALALRAVQFLAQRDRLHLSQSDAESALREMSIPARFEVHQLHEKTIVLDAAHNPQKLAALAATLRQVFPSQKFTFIVALGFGKDPLPLLEPLLPYARHFILTGITSESNHKLQSPQNVARALKRLSFHDFVVVPNASNAMSRALAIDSKLIIATGSLYLMDPIKQTIKQVDKAGLAGVI